MPAQEEWKPIPGFPDYMVSDRGRVVSHKRGKPKLLNPRVRTTGYRSVGLRNDPKQANPTTLFVHRLVLAAFVGPRPEGLVIRHLDGDPSNNVLGNLQYGTPSENSQDMVRHGRHLYASRTHCARGHEFNDANTVIRTDNSARRCRICANERAVTYYTRRALRAAGMEAAA